MERETKTLTTPLGKELVLKAWLTRKERADFAVDAEKAAKKLGLTSTTVQDSVEGELSILPLLIKVAVVSYDGSADNVDGRLDAVRADEGDFVAKEAAEVVKGNFQTAK